MSAKKLFILIVLSNFYFVGFAQEVTSFIQKPFKWPKDIIHVKLPNLSTVPSPKLVLAPFFLDRSGTNVEVKAAKVTVFLDGKKIPSGKSKPQKKNTVIQDDQIVIKELKPDTNAFTALARNSPSSSTAQIPSKGKIDDIWMAMLEENRLHTVRVKVSTNSQQADTTFSIKYINPFRNPTLHLVNIAIDYKGDTVANNDLQTVQEDAESISELFRAQEGLLYDAVKVQSLYNENASLSNINNLLLNLKAEEQDLVVIYIAAHGEKTVCDKKCAHGEKNACDKGGKVKLLGYNDHSNKDAAISSHDLQKYLAYIPCKTLLMLDVCYGSSLIKSLPSNHLVNTDFKNMRKVSDQLVKYPNAKIAIASAHGKAWETNKLKNSIFVNSLLSAFSKTNDSDKNKDEYLSLSELAVFITQEMYKHSKKISLPHIQKPDFSKVKNVDFPLFKLPKNM